MGKTLREMHINRRLPPRSETHNTAKQKFTHQSYSYKDQILRRRTSISCVANLFQHHPICASTMSDSVSTMVSNSWDMGCSDVVLESDSAIAVHLLNKAMGALHPLATSLWGCQDYIKKCLGCSIYHVYHECNMVFDRLANLGSCLDLGLCTFQVPPDSIRSSVVDDLSGLCRPRVIV
ncbi:unnamed protein product [Prunus armeniaca]